MVDSFGSPYADQADVSFQRKIDDGFRNMATTAVGRELEVAFVESCRSIGALPGEQANGWFRRRSIFILTSATGW